MRRLFWFGAGVAAGVALTRKVNETTRKATPVGMADQVTGAVRELAGAVGSFGAEVRAGMREREDELDETVHGVRDGEPLRPATNGNRAGSAETTPNGATPAAAERRARRAGR